LRDAGNAAPLGRDPISILLWLQAMIAALLR
jgi:hypothetical protein